eukprot:5492004-Heterocapsa_arctica.AAC.1
MQDQALVLIALRALTDLYGATVRLDGIGIGSCLQREHRVRMRSTGGEAKELKKRMRRRIRDSERARTSRRIRGKAQINGAKHFSLRAKCKK